MPGSGSAAFCAAAFRARAAPAPSPRGRRVRRPRASRGAFRWEEGARGPSPRAAASSPDACVFTVIVDDLVFPDGATKMGVLGGGGPQTAFGLRAHPSDLAVGLAAGVGPDLPAECLSWLRRNEVDDAGLALVVDRGEASEDAPAPASAPAWEGGARGRLRLGPFPVSILPRRARTVPPHPPAWQITEPDGRRTQVWRTPPCPDLYAMLRPPASALPPAYLAARAFHVGVHPERPDLDLLAALRAANPEATISVEPLHCRPERPPRPRRRRARVCRACDVFSPNESEAVSIVGPGDPRTLCERLAGLGARVVCLRRGENGSAAYDARAGMFHTRRRFTGSGRRFRAPRAPSRT